MVLDRRFHQVAVSEQLRVNVLPFAVGLGEWALVVRQLVDGAVLDRGEEVQEASRLYGRRLSFDVALVKGRPLREGGGGLVGAAHALGVAVAQDAGADRLGHLLADG